MTDFTSESSVINGLARCTINGFSQDIAKATITTVSGFDYSGWTCGGNPAAGVAPTTWAHPTQATLGALNPRYINPAAGTTCRILAVSFRPSVANQPYIVRDRIGHMAGLSGTSVAAQTVTATLTTPAADGRCEAGGGDVDWWIEIYTALGSTGINMTCAVTYSDNSTGNVVVAIPASVPAFRRYRIPPSSGNLSIKAISTLTNSATTGTAGNYGITATERKIQFSVATANTEWNADWALTNMPDIGSNACLELSTFAVGTAFGTMTGNFRAGTA